MLLKLDIFQGKKNEMYNNIQKKGELKRKDLPLQLFCIFCDFDFQKNSAFLPDFSFAIIYTREEGKMRQIQFLFLFFVLTTKCNEEKLHHKQTKMCPK